MPQIDMGEFYIDTWLAILLIICVLIFVVIAVIWGIKAHKYKISSGREDLIGKVAEVRTTLGPKGIVFVEGEQWTAISETDRVEPGEEVIINRVDNLKLYVTKKQ